MVVCSWTLEIPVIARKRMKKYNLKELCEEEKELRKPPGVDVLLFSCDENVHVESTNTRLVDKKMVLRIESGLHRSILINLDNTYKIINFKSLKKTWILAKKKKKVYKYIGLFLDGYRLYLEQKIKKKIEKKNEKISS